MKIGITLDLSINFWSNGLNQNVKFLYDLFRRLGHEVYYITSSKPYSKLSFNHKYMHLIDVVNDQSEVFDIIILAGFDVHIKFLESFKLRNSKLKIITLQLGNKLMFDLRNATHPPEGDSFEFNPVSMGDLISSIWISPHHAFGAEYVKVAYGNDNVKIAPYVWDPFFIQDKIVTLQDKGLSPFFNPELVNKVQIFESNTLINKNFLIPFCIAEKADKLFPEMLSGVNVFCCSRLRGTPHFESFMSRFDIVSRKDFTFFNNRWCTLDALSKFGGVIVSHQYDNDLNYAHYEALYMGVPLVHNSKALMDEGYYYPDFNVKLGAVQLSNAMNNHHKIHKEYMEKGRAFTAKYSPYNQEILDKYQHMLHED